MVNSARKGPTPADGAGEDARKMRHAMLATMRRIGIPRRAGSSSSSKGGGVHVVGAKGTTEEMTRPTRVREEKLKKAAAVDVKGLRAMGATPAGQSDAALLEMMRKLVLGAWATEVDVVKGSINRCEGVTGGILVAMTVSVTGLA